MSSDSRTSTVFGWWKLETGKIFKLVFIFDRWVYPPLGRKYLVLNYLLSIDWSCARPKCRLQCCPCSLLGLWLCSSLASLNLSTYYQPRGLVTDKIDLSKNLGLNAHQGRQWLNAKLKESLPWKLTKTWVTLNWNFWEAFALDRKNLVHLFTLDLLYLLDHPNYYSEQTWHRSRRSMTSDCFGKSSL